MTTFSKEDQASFEEAVKPIFDWLQKNGHPHTTILVTQLSAEVTEGLLSTISPLYREKVLNAETDTTP